MSYFKILPLYRLPSLARPNFVASILVLSITSASAAPFPLTTPSSCEPKLVAGPVGFDSIEETSEYVELREMILSALDRTSMSPQEKQKGLERTLTHAGDFAQNLVTQLTLLGDAFHSKSSYSLTREGRILDLSPRETHVALLTMLSSFRFLVLLSQPVTKKETEAIQAALDRFKQRREEFEEVRKEWAKGYKTGTSPQTRPNRQRVSARLHTLYYEAQDDFIHSFYTRFLGIDENRLPRTRVRKQAPLGISQVQDLLKPQLTETVFLDFIKDITSLEAITDHQLQRALPSQQVLRYVTPDFKALARAVPNSRMAYYYSVLARDLEREL